MRKQILLVEDEVNLRRVLGAQLVRDGYDVRTAGDGVEALRIFEVEPIDIVISDLRMPKLDGMALLKHIVSRRPEVPVILITAHGTIDTAVEALKLGAFDYVTKPFDRDEFRAIVAKAARTSELRLADVGPEGEKYQIIGKSRAMREVYAIIERVAKTPSTVLITGESGTGKELIATAIHRSSDRADKPFIRVNCAAIPESLVESELFGYEKGAFTGAVTSKPGRFELADQGTLFLDEIGDIPLAMQVKLLRALQDRSFERVGGIKPIHVDVRLIAATNRDLGEAIRQGKFREDLYYRLNIVQIHLPPLRERKEDIPIIAARLVARQNERLKKNVLGITDRAMEVLLNHDWPGNVRELENVIERSALFCEDGERIDIIHLPKEILARQREVMVAVPILPTGIASEPTQGVHLEGQRRSLGTSVGEAEEGEPRISKEVGLKEIVRETTARLERDLILNALAQTMGNVTQAAKLLKISRKSLQLKMKELGLREASKEDSKEDSGKGSG
ncbi:MAG: sigma-54 dependent transcriptional regulator [Sandaracinaceae bacterium]|nr:sigma-54 dependent transcriptional regulator [Sandaracinaceae bacterium]